MAPALAQDALGSSGGAFGTPRDKFYQLVNDLSRILGPSSGLDSADIDVKHLEELMISYVSRESEWQKYAFSDLSRGYTRNLVDEGNGKSNLLVLVWTPGKGSPIHDHADAHCLMKVLKGTLRETRFSYPDPSAPSSGPQVIKETSYKENEVTYMADELGLHKISNPDQERLAVSLHRKCFQFGHCISDVLGHTDTGAFEGSTDHDHLVYTPPNAAREGCNIFCEKTGKSSHVTQSNFYSIFGCKVGV